MGLEGERDKGYKKRMEGNPYTELPPQAFGGNA